MYKYAFLAVFLSLTCLVNGQNTKIINKDFDIELYNSIEFDLYGETIFEAWEADYILVETTVKLWDTPKRLFQNEINKGRYYCHIKAEGDIARIAAIPITRNKLSTRESTVSIVYYPANFILSDSKVIRQDDAVTLKEEK